MSLIKSTQLNLNYLGSNVALGSVCPKPKEKKNAYHWSDNIEFMILIVAKNVIVLLTFVSDTCMVM